MKLIPHTDLTAGQLIIGSTADPLRVLDIERTTDGDGYTESCVWAWNVSLDGPEAPLYFEGRAMVQLYEPAGA